MTANTNRFSTYTTVSGGSEGKDGEKKKDMWSSMLDSVASGKRLPERNLLVLGEAEPCRWSRASSRPLTHPQEGPSTRSGSSSRLSRTKNSDGIWTDRPPRSRLLLTTLLSATHTTMFWMPIKRVCYHTPF